MTYFECKSRETGKLPMSVARADTFFSRLRGLAFSSRVDRSLWIVPCGSIHTFWMRFDLHIIFLDGEDKVLKVAADVPPNRGVVCRGARSVLEIPAELLASHLLPHEGSTLSFSAITEDLLS